MAKEPDDGYVSPWADLQSSDPKERHAASQALGDMLDYYTPNIQGETVHQKIGRIAMMSFAVKSYDSLVTKAASEGLRDASMQAYVARGLKEAELIDPNCPVKAEHQYGILSNGVELNRTYWNQRLGRMRSFINILRDNPIR